MKYVTLFLLFVVIATNVFAQSEKEKQEVLAEANKLYRSEMASWYGTDIFMADFKAVHSRTQGYFSYVDNDKSVCVFFSKEQPARILASFTFDSTYNVKTAVVDGVERDLNSLESDLHEIRMTALEEYKSDTALFKRYNRMNPNFIPLSDKEGKRVYVLTGPQDNGVVVFGNDYLLTFNSKNKLKEKKRLHSNIITVTSKGSDGKKLLSTVHSHLPETGSMITAADICTLRLYCPFTEWKQHYVISEKFVSIWDCSKELVIMPRDAWDKLNKAKN
ncbi:MAG: hypothetical protein WDO14_10040 [Bacteroidota bacterium]